MLIVADEAEGTTAFASGGRREPWLHPAVRSLTDPASGGGYT
jgi:hypothetical protein